MAVSDKKLNKQLRLIDSAYELFTQKGVNMTAVDDVVKKAGVAKGTFYLYFKDKYDLLDQIVLKRSEMIVLEVADELENTENRENMSTLTLLHIFADRLIDKLEENRDLMMIIEKNLSVCFERIINTDNERLAARLEKLYEFFLQCGLNREKAKQYLYLLSNMIGSACCDTILKSAPFTLAEIKGSIHEIIGKILTPEKKEEQLNA